MGPTTRSRLLYAFAGGQAADAVAVAIPLPFIEQALDRIECPPGVRTAIPVVKAASAAGLVAGRRYPVVGRVTAIALVAYFGAAIGFHLRAGDGVADSAPAAALAAVSAGAALTLFD